MSKRQSIRLSEPVISVDGNGVVTTYQRRDPRLREAEESTIEQLVEILRSAFLDYRVAPNRDIGYDSTHSEYIVIPNIIDQIRLLLDKTRSSNESKEVSNMMAAVKPINCMIKLLKERKYYGRTRLSLRHLFRKTNNFEIFLGDLIKLHNGSTDQIKLQIRLIIVKILSSPLDQEFICNM